MKLLKKMAIVVIFCAVLTGIIFFIKDKHDNNIENTYINYVNDILIPKYGKSSLYLENGNDLTIEGEKLLNKEAEGILLYKIIDLDKDSNKNLILIRIDSNFNTKYKNSIDINIIYDIYTINNKNIHQIHFKDNKFNLVGDFIKSINKNKFEYSLFINNHKSNKYLCTNILNISDFGDDFYFNLNIFKLNNTSINLDYSLGPEINAKIFPENPFRLIEFYEKEILFFENKTDLKNKCISDTKKYGLDNLVENIFNSAENKFFTDVSKLNNIDKIISIKIK